jgi:excisionase family DNA binding protein
VDKGLAKINKEKIVDDGLAKIGEGAKFLGVCRAKIYGLMDSGELPYAKIGKCRRIPWAALKAFAGSAMV